MLLSIAVPIVKSCLCVLLSGDGGGGVGSGGSDEDDDEDSDSDKESDLHGLHTLLSMSFFCLSSFGFK